MKRIIIFCLLAVLSAAGASAQSKVYCELVGTQGLFSKKVTIQVDFGQETKLFSNNTLVDDKGEAIVFNSMVDAMNYMGKLGWEFEQAYVVTLGSGASGSNVDHWLLSKYIGEDGDGPALETKSIVKQEAKEEELESTDPE